MPRPALVPFPTRPHGSANFFEEVRQAAGSSSPSAPAGGNNGNFFAAARRDPTLRYSAPVAVTPPLHPEEELLFGRDRRAAGRRLQYDGIIGAPAASAEFAPPPGGGVAESARERALARFDDLLQRPPSSWSVAEACLWLEHGCDLPQLRTKFAHHRVDGAVLLKYATQPARLFEALQIDSLGAREGLTHALRQLADASLRHSGESEVRRSTDAAARERAGVGGPYEVYIGAGASDVFGTGVSRISHTRKLKHELKVRRGGARGMII